MSKSGGDGLRFGETHAGFVEDQAKMATAWRVTLLLLASISVTRWLDKTAQELEPVLLIIDLNIQDNQNGLITHSCSTE